MKKRYLLSAVGAVGAGLASYYLKDEKNRNKIKDTTTEITNKMKKKTDNTFENAGVPDQSAESDQDTSQRENSKMVSEGSQFGVQYYNEKKEENTTDRQQQ
ncbi:hypothetical protein [Oceanobacillus damuensis]|uniref:hypothetical protein n=1 Tax=Oceanobacillus damuensis TaxID=937928 RepID=UPI00082FA3AA|nr:hypothetical protein [Oceanobacillus damuensis]